MGKLKAKWEKTDIPKDTKIKLWRIMKDCKTYNDRKAYIANHEELFDKEEHDKCSAYVRDTFKALEREIKDMPLSEVSSLPDDLQKWSTGDQGSYGCPFCSHGKRKRSIAP